MAGKEQSPEDFIQEAKDTLEQSGFSVDVDAVLSRIEEEKQWNFKVTRENVCLDLKNLPIEDTLTSELVQMWTISTDPKYEKELEKRLSLLELNSDQKKRFIAFDLEALAKKDQKLVKEGIADNQFHMGSIKSLSKVESLTASNLANIAYIASWGLETQHEWVTDESIKAMSFVLSADGPFEKEFRRRADIIGLKKWQRGSFIRNEDLILKRAVLGHAEKSWTPETLVKQTEGR